MKFKDLKTYIANALEREESAFIEEGFNTLAQAISNGMRSLQREHDFEWCRTFANVTITSGQSWEMSKLVDGNTNEAIEVKKIERAYLYAEENDGKALIPVRVVSPATEHTKEIERLETRMSSYRTHLRLERHGRFFKVLGASKFGEKLTFRFDVVKWLPPFDTDNDENFLSTIGIDVLLYHVLSELNLFMHEGEKVQLSTGFYRARLASLLKWDADQFENVADDIFE